MKNSNNNTGNHDGGSGFADDDLRLNINDRSLSVYERYLKKVMQDNSSDKPPSAVNAHNNVSSYDKTVITSKNTPFNAAAKAKTTSTKHAEPIEDRSSSSVKLLIILGVFCAALLIGVIVVILNATGVLVSLTDRLASSDSQAAMVSSSSPVIESAQAVADETVTDRESINTGDSKIEDDNLSHLSITAAAKPINENVENTEVDELSTVYSVKRAAGTEDYEPVDTKPKMVTRTQTLKLPDNTVEKTDDEASQNESESAISFDDFREEAQIVIYREVPD